MEFCELGVVASSGAASGLGVDVFVLVDVEFVVENFVECGEALCFSSFFNGVPLQVLEHFCNTGF